MGPHDGGDEAIVVAVGGGAGLEGAERVRTDQLRCLGLEQLLEVRAQGSWWPPLTAIAKT
jgi:hypothetical protein